MFYVSVIKNKFLYISAGITLFLLILNLETDLIYIFRGEYAFTETMFTKSMISDQNIIAVPLLASLPFATVFTQEMNSGFMKIAIFKIGYKHYIFGKVFHLALTAILSQIFAILLFTFILYIPLGIFYMDLNMTIARLFIAVIFAIIGSALGVFVKDTVFALVTPVAMAFFLKVIGERFLSDFDFLQINDWFSGQYNKMLAIIALILLAVYVIFLKVEVRKNV